MGECWEFAGKAGGTGRKKPLTWDHRVSTADGKSMISQQNLLCLAQGFVAASNVLTSRILPCTSKFNSQRWRRPRCQRVAEVSWWCGVEYWFLNWCQALAYKLTVEIQTFAGSIIDKHIVEEYWKSRCVIEVKSCPSLDELRLCLDNGDHNVMMTYWIDAKFITLQWFTSRNAAFIKMLAVFERWKQMFDQDIPLRCTGIHWVGDLRNQWRLEDTFPCTVFPVLNFTGKGRKWSLQAQFNRAP